MGRIVVSATLAALLLLALQGDHAVQAAADGQGRTLERHAILLHPPVPPPVKLDLESCAVRYGCETDRCGLPCPAPQSGDESCRDSARDRTQDERARLEARLLSEGLEEVERARIKARLQELRSSESTPPESNSGAGEERSPAEGRKSEAAPRTPHAHPRMRQRHHTLSPTSVA